MGKKHYTLRLVLSFLDQCKSACPHLSGRSPALAKESEEDSYSTRACTDGAGRAGIGRAAVMDGEGNSKKLGLADTSTSASLQ